MDGWTVGRFIQTQQKHRQLFGQKLLQSNNQPGTFKFRDKMQNSPLIILPASPLMHAQISILQNFFLKFMTRTKFALREDCGRFHWSKSEKIKSNLKLPLASECLPLWRFGKQKPSLCALHWIIFVYLRDRKISKN